MIADISHIPFLRSICSDRDSDTPRLVYADWLDEHDQPLRAELIRVQCEKASIVIPRGGFGRTVKSHEYFRWQILDCRERELLDANELDWIPECLSGVLAIAIADHVTAPQSVRESRKFTSPVKWTRGFISHVTLDWQTWLTHHASLYWPVVKCERCKGSGKEESDDRTPVESAKSHGPSEWLWHCHHTPVHPHHLSAKTFRNLAGFSRSAPDHAFYPSQESAMNAYEEAVQPCPACRGTGTVEPTMECERCKGRGHHGNVTYSHCFSCDGGLGKPGTGRVPRTFRGTEQPLEEVTLTWPVFPDTMTAEDIPGLLEPTREHLAAEWPGLKFNLPLVNLPLAPDASPASR